MAYNTSYYDNAINEYNKKVDSDTKTQITDAQNSANSQLKQAYISRMQNQQKLNNQLAQAGIRGGVTETSNIKLDTDYGNTRNTINSDLTNTIKDINTTAQDNKFNYTQTMNSAKQEYIQNREAEDRANAREDAQIKAQQQKDFYTARYSQYYDINKLEKLKKGTGIVEQAVIDARIAYLRQAKKGY